MPVTEQQFGPQITVGTYTMPYEADIVWSLLEAFEVPVVPADYNTIYIDWLYSNALGGIKLRVSEQDADEAREIIEGAIADGEELQLTHSEGACPHCNNSHAALVVRGRQWAVVTWLIIGIPLVWPRARLRCLSCGHMWRQ